MISWMFAAGAAGFAFLLSFLVGLISRVGFGTLLLRALVSAIVFALLTAGMEILMRRLLPELLTASADTGGETESAGGTVDITLDDSEEQNSGSDNQDSAEGSEVDSGDMEGGFVEEISSNDSDVAENVFSSDTVAVGDEPEEVGTLESMDELPSLDSFSDSFESSVGSESDNRPVSSAQEIDVDVLGEVQNSGEVAKAVKTMMKRDQEG